MNELKKKWDFIFPITAVVVAIIATICNLTYGIDTLFDEGSHTLDMLASLSDGFIPGDDRTWWSDIFLTILGRDICSSVISLRVVKLCVAILTSVLFWILTWDVTKTNWERAGYLSVILLFSILTMGGIIVCYNSMSQLLFVIGCGVLYRLCKAETLWPRLAYSIVLGSLLTFSLFAVIVSGVVVSAAMLFLVVYRFWNRWKEMLSVLGVMLLGGILTLAWVHFCAVPLTEVWANITDIGESITKVNRGYDPFSMVMQMALFLRDMVLCILTLIGINYVAQKIQYHSYRWIAGLVYVALFIMYAHYQTKPQVTIPMLLAVVWVQAYLAKYGARMEKIAWKNIFRFEHVFNIFLIVFPFIAVLGTVVYIGMKMMWFIIPWVFLAWRNGFAEECNIRRAEVLLVVSLLMIVPSVQSIRSIDREQKIVESGMFTGMHLTPAQAEHFEMLDSILGEYNFEKNKSIVFTTQLSMATVCYIEAIPCGFYFEPMDFIAHLNDRTPIPNYIFMNEFDHTIAAATMHQAGWGWPDEFDKYFIGSPDASDIGGYTTHRWLYCRKSCRVMNND